MSRINLWIFLWKWTVEYKPLFSNDKASITQTFLLNAKDRILYTEDNSWRLELK
jgi:hypothetical protein